MLLRQLLTITHTQHDTYTSPPYHVPRHRRQEAKEWMNGWSKGEMRIKVERLNDWRRLEATKRCSEVRNALKTGVSFTTDSQRHHSRTSCVLEADGWMGEWMNCMNINIKLLIITKQILLLMTIIVTKAELIHERKEHIHLILLKLKCFYFPHIVICNKHRRRTR